MAQSQPRKNSKQKVQLPTHSVPLCNTHLYMFFLSKYQKSFYILEIMQWLCCLAETGGTSGSFK